MPCENGNVGVGVCIGLLPEMNISTNQVAKKYTATERIVVTEVMVYLDNLLARFQVPHQTLQHFQNTTDEGDKGVERAYEYIWMQW